MGKKDKAIRRLEAEVGRLTTELSKVEKAARKRISRAEDDVAALRNEVLKLIGRGSSGKGSSDKGASGKGSSDKGSSKSGAGSESLAVATEAPAQKEPAQKDSTQKDSAQKDQAQKDQAQKAPAQKAPNTNTAPAKKSAAGRKPSRSGPTVAELRQQAKAKGIKGYSSMTKAQLLNALT